MRDCGNEGFNRIEERVNSEITAQHCVIATGGSVVYGPKAMAHLREISTVVYLKVSCPVLEQRLGDLNERGVVLDPDETLKDLYERRVPLYEKYAHLTVDVSQRTVQQAVRAIAGALH
jgi:shikimate kinase